MKPPWRRVEKVVPGEAQEWLCEFCRNKRPEERISVTTRIRFVNGIRVEDARAFCNDRNGCVDMAMRWRNTGR